MALKSINDFIEGGSSLNEALNAVSEESGIGIDALRNKYYRSFPEKSKKHGNCRLSEEKRSFASMPIYSFQCK